MKTNNLKHIVSVNNEQINAKVEIRLNDECKNGHQDFAITATFWEVGKVRNDRNSIIGGCCHKEILKHFPEFKIFVNLHLSDCKGRPMYAEANGIYHFENTSFEVAKNYLRLTNEEAEALNKFTKDKLIFKATLENLGVVKRWESEANEAIKLLEELTGNEFVNDSKRYQYTPLTAEEWETVNRISNPLEYIEEQQRIKAEEKYNKDLETLNKEEAEAFSKVKNEFDLKRQMLELKLNKSNFIYYSHSKTFTLNWKEWEKYNELEIELIKNSIVLPDGVELVVEGL